MVKIDNKYSQIHGAEGIILHNNCIVLGMQKPKRWYTLSNGKQAAIIKTIGGQVENSDKNDAKITLIRETMEEIQGIESKDIKVSTNPIFIKRVRMGEINPYEQESNLTMQARFYLVKIRDKIEILPNDLPALLEIPINELIKLQFCKNMKLDSLYGFLVKNKMNDFDLPNYCAFMLPEEVREFIEKIKNHIPMSMFGKNLLSQKKYKLSDHLNNRFY